MKWTEMAVKPSKDIEISKSVEQEKKGLLHEKKNLSKVQKS